MIVVIGSTYLRGDGSTGVPDGVAGRIAVAAAVDGAAVELIAKIGDDPAGDALLVALAKARVGHVAVLRDAVHPTAHRADDADENDGGAPDPADDAPSSAPWLVEPVDASALEAADVGLALRYLTDYRVIVAVHTADAIVDQATAAADWAGAHLVLVTAPGAAVGSRIPDGALVIEDTGDDAADASTALAERLGQYAAAIDGGSTPVAAYAVLTTTTD